MENCKTPDKTNPVGPARWAQVENLYHDALALATSERAGYLDQACSGDEELRREVESLLLHADEKLSNPFLADRDLADPARTLTQKGAPGLWSKPFHPGQAIDDRFEIIREIGEGGMGVVYEAFDRLRRLHIAIKAAKPEFRRFLSPELEGALKVRHPNVCLVNQIHRAKDPSGDVDFLTMELLEGETLAAVIKRRGSLPLEEARVIALQLWSGLNQSHRSGVVHRDLKAGNVILCGLENSQPTAVITDFGLCGEAEQRGVFGTRRYMAPELIMGQKAAKASDIYALGIILYEMVAGISREETPPGLTGRSLKQSDPYYRLIDDLLSIHPETRLQAFAKAPALLSRRAVTRRQILAGAAASVSVLVGGSWLERERIQDWLSPLPKRRFVALLAWPPTLGLQEKSLIEAAIDAIESELARQESADHDLFVISARNAAVEARDAHWLAKLADTLGVNMVLQISSSEAAGSVSLLLKLLDVSTGSALRQRQINDSLSDLAALPSRAVEAAAGLLGVRWDGAMQGRTTRGAPSPGALEAYQQAEVLRHKPNDDGLQPAIEMYKRAIDADPQYAAAYARLAIAYARFFALSGDLGALELVQINAEKAIQLDASSDWGHLALAKFHDGHGDLQRAQAEIQSALRLNPSNHVILLWQSQIFRHFHRWKEAEQTLLRLKQERPNYWLVYNELGALYTETDRFQEAIQAFLVAAAAAPGYVMTASNLGVLYFKLNQLPQAEECYRRSLALKPSADCYANLAEVLRVRGKFSEALAAAQKATKLEPSDDENWLALADCLEAMGGHQANAQDAFRTAELNAERRQTADPSDGTLLIRLALYRVKTHSPKDVWPLVRKSEQQGRLDVDNTMIKARIFELVGRRQEAIAVVASCLRRGMLSFQVDTIRDLRGLRTDPSYSRIVKASI